MFLSINEFTLLIILNLYDYFYSFAVVLKDILTVFKIFFKIQIIKQYY